MKTFSDYVKLRREAVTMGGGPDDASGSSPDMGGGSPGGGAPDPSAGGDNGGGGNDLSAALDIAVKKYRSQVEALLNKLAAKDPDLQQAMSGGAGSDQDNTNDDPSNGDNDPSSNPSDNG